MKKKKEQDQPGVRGRWAVVIVVLLLLAMISFITALIIGVFLSTSEMHVTEGNVAHIKLHGPILPDQPAGFLSAGVVSSTETVRQIRKAEENPDVKAILLEINSPGGTPVASYEIADAISKVNKSTVAWIREVGASGAYWAASACDHIVANPMTMTGSIGVMGSYIEWEGTLHKYNASYRRLVSGKYKDMGSPFKTMTEEEQDIMQSSLDAMRAMFVESVAENRNLDKTAVDEIADGRFYIGRDALELGLIDRLGGKQEAVMWIEDKEGIKAELAEYKKPKTLAQLLTEVMSEHGFLMGLGIGESMGVENRNIART